MRIIIYTGKGGVGKTSVAAATAVRLAKQGLRTLIMSTDAAHSLADSLDTTLGPEPVHVSDRLWAQEVDSVKQTEKHWGAVQGWLSGFMGWAKLDDVATEEMLVFPGMEELFSLMELKRHAAGGEYDAIVVDCAPTGETLRLLSYPSVLGWWVNKIFPVERRLIKLARPVAKLVAGGLELPDDNVMNSVESFVRELEALQEWIMDGDVTTVRLVVNPEKMVISEARRAFTYLNLYGFHTDAVVVNRIWPPEATGGYWTKWRTVQEKYMEEIEDSFGALPTFRIPMMESEVVGVPMLERLGDIAFEGSDVSAVLHRDKTQSIRKEGDGYLMELALPFVEKELLQLNQRGDELTVQAGPYKRKVVLPNLLLGRSIEGARFTDGRLVLRFGERQREHERAEEE
ncbi:ArsA family ATPase [Paenibacillus flagellatus]|uniref:arsenite-transporting ATPase n=1 Tax=Paenibacillus flagellatus TaxID=2211139 RepID=A0A2V5KQA2_9BACL|nr:ArsA family ATPase [Paenibacillus flagellatus]PYI53467.1 arsenic-transporting ATPase [Paenibacillus flagellatus]